jgi:hypothetical protein
VSKAAQNAIRNKAKKQAAARLKLEQARQEGLISLVEVVLMGNQYTRQVLNGRHLSPDVARFKLTPEEEALLLTTDRVLHFLDMERKEVERVGLEGLLEQAKIRREFLELEEILKTLPEEGLIGPNDQS